MSNPVERPASSVHDQNPTIHYELQSNLQRIRHFVGRTLAAAALSMGLATGEAVLGSMPAAYADTGGYPDADAADCSEKYGQYSWCKGSPSKDISPRGYGYRNCTDWAAFRIKVLTGVTLPRNLGNAKAWDENAATVFAVDTMPEANDIAVWNSGTFGHVAIVESVNANGSVNVSEYNKKGTGEYGVRSDLKADAYIDADGPAKTVPALPEAPPTNPYGTKNVTVVPNIFGGLSMFTASDGGLMGYKDQSYPGEDLKAKPWGTINEHLKGTPELVRRTDGTLSVFGHGADGRLHHAWQTAPGTTWSESISPWDVSLRGDPSAATNYTGGISVFFPDSNGAMRQIDQMGANKDMGSSPVHNLGGNLQGKPAVVNVDNVLAVFAHGADGRLQTNYQRTPGGVWSGWEILGNQKIQGDPKVIFNRLGGISVMAIGEHGDIVGIDQTRKGESMNKPFYSLAKPAGIDFAGTPGIAQTANGEQMVFATAANGAVYHKAQVHTNHYNWTDFFPLGGNLIGAPTVTQNSSGGVSIFGRNPDGTVVTLDQTGYGRSFNTSWIGLAKP